jgi:uncharacterized protein YjbI with pentapeptide repeats
MMGNLAKGLFAAAYFALVLVTHTRAQGQEEQVCPHMDGWKPTNDELNHILAEHQQWAAEWKKASFSNEWANQHSQGRANLCNANLTGAKLNRAYLPRAKLNGANLDEAELNMANLRGAKLNRANLSGAKLNGANLDEAELNMANLRGAKLNRAHLGEAQLNKADLWRAQLNEAFLPWAELNESNLGRAQLNGANLGAAKLNKANLGGAKLNEASLVWAELNEANLGGAELNKANLVGAQLNKTDLGGAKLNGANLVRAELHKASLVGTELNKADLSGAKLNMANLPRAELNEAYLDAVEMNEANLSGAKLNEANLSGAKLNRANLVGAELNEAGLGDAELNEANLGGAELNEASLVRAELKDATLAGVVLAKALYAPASLPPNGFVAGIKGLETVVFPPGEEIGLVQLRKLLQDGGLRDLERQATYAIEHGKTLHAIENWKEEPARAAEGVFRLIAFELTTGYGLRPGRALLLLLTSIGVFGVIYATALFTGLGGIYRLWPDKRLERELEVKKLVGLRWVNEVGMVKPTDKPKIEPLLSKKPLVSLCRGLQFSLLSAFHIGFRELNVGTWIARLQTREYTLQAIGWVRAVAGFQSLMSVYLLAIWALTYFGRPFQ